MSAGTTPTTETEVSILARILTNEDGHIPEDTARHLLGLAISKRDQARMHELALRNQDDALTPAEKEELFAYGKAGTVLSILKSKARRTLGIKLERCSSHRPHADRPRNYRGTPHQ